MLGAHRHITDSKRIPTTTNQEEEEARRPAFGTSNTNMWIECKFFLYIIIFLIHKI
jgi:hypothetical protein